MEVEEISFLPMKPELIELLRNSDFTDVTEISENISSCFSKELDNRIFIDQLFKDFLLELVPKSDNERLEKYMHYVIQACRIDLCPTTLPAILLGDIFDMLTLERCEQLFGFVEKNVSIWKESIFFGACKNNILRICNDLLRRLSRSQNTIFCGRILLFLAKFFPFSERSGLNIVSEFNLDNVTEFGGDEDVDVFGSEDNKLEDENKTNRMNLDYTIYSKFWSLQDFFRCPNNCYNKPKWNLFCAYADTILSTFKHYKLDHITEKPSNSTAMEVNENQHYFPKYLTSQRLLELQLSDINFRRYVLTQFLILFQYLNAPVKFKLDSYEFKSDQIDWLKGTERRIYHLLLETPPDGEKFATTIHHLLQREDHWNNWKNEGCPEVKMPATFHDNELETKPSVLDAYKPTKPIGDLIKDISSCNKYYLGNRQLTKLWNICPDNLTSCRSKERNFLPTLQDYFEDVLVEANPESCIDEEYRKVNNKDFSWRGLRLLARKCPYFFTQNNTLVLKTSHFIENIVGKFLEERPISAMTAMPAVDSKVEINENDPQDDFIEQEEGEVITQSAADDVGADMKRDSVTQEQLDRVAEMITENWKKVAVKIGYQPDEIEFFSTEKPTDEQRARYLLQVWSEDCDDPSSENLAYILEGLDMHGAANVLKSNGVL